MKKYLQIDGGGIIGASATAFLKILENRLNTKLCYIFDYMYGTSTGSIITGCLSVGTPASKIHDFYKLDSKRLFKPRTKWNPLNWLNEKYDKKPFEDTIYSIVGNSKLSDTKNNLTITTFNNCSGRTHYLNTKDNPDIKLKDAIYWSALSACHYFGSYRVPDYKWKYKLPNGKIEDRIGADFVDGGQGTNNCTINDVLSHILSNHPNENVYILSIGCGIKDSTHSLKKVNDGYISEIIKYPFQARNEATIDQILNAEYVTKNNKKIIFRRLDFTIPDKMNEIDKIEYLDYYINMGETEYLRLFDMNYSDMMILKPYK